MIVAEKTEFNAKQVEAVCLKAEQEARRASKKFFDERLGGRDQYACGFAWVTVHGVRSNSRLGKTLQTFGFRKSYTGGLQLWNPSKAMVQNVDTLEAGAEAYADVLRLELGLEAYAGSRLD